MVCYNRILTLATKVMSKSCSKNDTETETVCCLCRKSSEPRIISCFRESPHSPGGTGWSGGGRFVFIFICAASVEQAWKICLRFIVVLLSCLLWYCKAPNWIKLPTRCSVTCVCMHTSLYINIHIQHVLHSLLNYRFYQPNIILTKQSEAALQSGCILDLTVCMCVCSGFPERAAEPLPAGLCKPHRGAEPVSQGGVGLWPEGQSSEDRHPGNSVVEKIHCNNSDILWLINTVSLLPGFLLNNICIYVWCVFQCSKLLSDTSVIQFYPSKFVLITDILDTFGAQTSLVYLS